MAVVASDCHAQGSGEGFEHGFDFVMFVGALRFDGEVHLCTV